MKSKEDDAEEARKELIGLYLGIKLRKEKEVIDNLFKLNRQYH